MESRRGAETADITYNDMDGEFTRLLISSGYLDDTIWANASPKYFLEVKATTKACATRFFLSKSQYQRVRVLLFQAHISLLIILDAPNEVGCSFIGRSLYHSSRFQS